MHTFPHFVVHLKSRFCTLALIFVFDVNIYFSSLRLFTIDHVISLLPATPGQYMILALSLLYISRTEDFRTHNVCPIHISLHNSKLFKQNGFLL